MTYRRAVRYLGSVSLLLIILVAGTTAQQTASTFSDNFHSTTLDSTHWRQASTRAIGTVKPTMQGLEVSLKFGNQPPFFAKNLWLACRIRGDFDAQVSYRLLEWPRSNGVRLGLGVLPKALPLGSTNLLGMNGRERGLSNAITERIDALQGEIAGQPGGGDFHVGDFNGRFTQFIPTGNPVGKLRLARVGTTFTAYYLQGKDWSPLGIWSVVNTEDEWLAIQLWSTHLLRDQVKVRLENFSISATGLDCP